MPVLEICCYNHKSCLIAQQNGAGRVEYCDNAAEGGTTPSYGSIVHAREQLQIPLFPIIRPRGGDFLYNDDEFLVMQKDIAACKQIGCDGVVIGLLRKDGTVDRTRAARLVQLAYPMSVTFHRAFDRVLDPFEALEELVSIGCERILTSGGRPKATEAMDLIGQLVRQANERIIVMPGSGVRAANIAALFSATGASEYHSSASTTVRSPMQFINEKMDESLSLLVCDGSEVSRMVSELNGLDQQKVNDKSKGPED